MDLETPFGADQILEISGKVYDLVLSYKGSITAEHNDGLVRTPYLEQMYGPEVYALFTQTKKIFDPINIFNPGKKVALGAGLAGTKEYLHNHIVRKKK
jgi:FAD/FMN-containing dehydrogenase